MTQPTFRTYLHGIRFFSRVNLLAILACLLWSTAFVGVKVGLRYSDPFSFAGIRFMLAGIMLLPFWWQKDSQLTYRAVRKNIRVILLVCFFQTFFMYGLFYLAMTMVSGAVAAILIGASPLTAALTAHFMVKGDTMTIPKAVSLCLGMGGVILLTLSRQPWASPTGLTEFIGILLLFICTVSSALGNVLVAKEKSDLDPIFLNSLQIFLGGFLLYLVSVFQQGISFQLFPVEYYASLLWLSFVSAVSFTLWFVLLQYPGVKVSQLNLWKFIIPVFGAVISWTLLPEESPGVFPIIGMACIALSIILFNISDIRHQGL
jgi:drug/metabolite transporter (DMT)-like permease